MKIKYYGVMNAFTTAMAGILTYMAVTSGNPPVPLLLLIFPIGSWLALAFGKLRDVEG